MRTQVELLRLDIEALDAAVAAFAKRTKVDDISPVKGAKQPGNTYDRTLLVETYSQGLTGMSFSADVIDVIQKLSVNCRLCGFSRTSISLQQKEVILF